MEEHALSSDAAPPAIKTRLFECIAALSPFASAIATCLQRRENMPRRFSAMRDRSVSQSEHILFRFREDLFPISEIGFGVLHEMAAFDIAHKRACKKTTDSAQRPFDLAQ